MVSGILPIKAAVWEAAGLGHKVVAASGGALTRAVPLAPWACCRQQQPSALYWVRSIKSHLV